MVTDLDWAVAFLIRILQSVLEVGRESYTLRSDEFPPRL
jgi:hypothetical protein